MNHSSSSLPKLLFVIADSSRSGAPRQVLTLMKGLGDAYRLALACTEGWLADEAKKLRADVFILPPTRFKSINFLKKIYTETKPDLIHCHGVRGGVLGLFAIGSSTKVPPVLYTEHTWTEDFPMTSKVRKSAHIFLLRTLLQKATKVIAVSKAVESFFTHHHIVPASKIHVIYGGVASCPEVEPTDKPVIGMLGSLVKVKGIDLLLQALALLRRSYPDVRCKIGGTGKDIFSFQYLAHKLKIDRMVEWVGEVQDPHDFFEQIRVFVQPSWSEAFGLSVLEAMACGIPVIVSRTGGLKEIVEDNENGLTFPKGEINVLASQLELLLHDQQLYEKLSQKGRERAALFSIERMLQNHREVYQQLLQK